MDVILRFGALRTLEGEPTPAVTLATDSALQHELVDIVAAGGGRNDVASVVQTFVDTGFLRDVDQVTGGASLADVVDRVRAGQHGDVADLTEAITIALDGAEPASYVTDLWRARDSVVAAYLTPGGLDATAAETMVRGYALAEAARTGLESPEQVSSIVDGPMALPEFLTADAPAAGRPAPESTSEEQAQRLADGINRLASHRQALAAAIEELDLRAEDELEVSELGTRRPLRELYQAEASESAPPGAQPDDTGTGARVKAAIEIFDDRVIASPLLRAGVLRNVYLSPHSARMLPAQVVDTVRDLGLDPVATSVGEMRLRAGDEHREVGRKLMELSGDLAKITKFGPDALAAVHVDPKWRLDPVDDPESSPPIASAAPTTHTPVKPLGIADLVLVRAHVDRYERAEVAATVDVLPHETLTHTVRRLDSDESSSTDDRESTDLRSQIQGLADQDSGRTSVQAVGPGMGPLAAEGPTGFARSVTEQVTASSTARVRRLSTRRRLREIEETSEHVVDNHAGTTVAHGVYQRLDLVYTAQAFSNGARLLYDVVVPEPAALFLETLSRPRSGLARPVRPAPFKVRPADLSIDNWAYYATGHHASGVDAPPAGEVVVTEPFGGRAKDPFSTDAVTNSLLMAEARGTRIPKGYRADRYRVVVQCRGYDGGFVAVSIGSKSFALRPANGVYVRSGTLDGEIESLPVAVEIDANGVDWGVLSATVAVEVVCRATPELMSAWQVRTHAQILEANQRRFRDYEEEMATTAATARAVVQSLTPARKVDLVRTEMKRSALGLLTGQSFSGFNASRVDAGGFPYPDAVAAGVLSAYTRFFEQAIEWEHLAYSFYPYFWGSQASWVAKISSSESDPQFASFLTSGAARIVLPVRPGYEVALERFLNTGVVPTSDELLDVGGPMWVSLVEQLRRDAAADGGAGAEAAIGEPWEFRIATDLVRARADGSMPRWTLAQGGWSDAADPDF